MSRDREEHARRVREGIARARVLRQGEGAGTPRRSQASEVYERPAVMPRDPALVMEERFERDFVKAQRARGVSWFNIAKMTRRTAPYLKALYGDGIGW